MSFRFSVLLTLSLTVAGYTMDQNYIPPMRMSQPAPSSGAPAFSQTVSSSPALYQSKTMPATTSSSRRHSELPSSNSLDPSYHQSYRRTSNPYDSTGNGDFSMAPSQSIPSISGLSHSQVPSSNIGVTAGPGMMPQYNTNVGRYVVEHRLRKFRSQGLTVIQVSQPLRP